MFYYDLLYYIELYQGLLIILNYIRVSSLYWVISGSPHYIELYQGLLIHHTRRAWNQVDLTFNYWQNLSNVLVVKWYLSVVKLLTTDKCTLWKYNFGNFIFKTFILKLKFYFYLNRYYTWSMAMAICFIWILKLGPFSKFILTFEWVLILVFIFIWILLIIQ